jgi:hypothetical protein
MHTIAEKSIPLEYDTVNGQVVPDISKDCSSFIYRVQAQESMHDAAASYPRGTNSSITLL